MKRAAELLLESLRDCGVEYIFGLPGSTEAPLLDAITDFPDIHYVLALHESIVIGMADGFARASGRPSVANLHTTVGTGNGLTGLFNAWKDASPVVTIATHKHSRILSRDGFCVGPDLAEWARPVTKWAWQGLHADQVRNEVIRGLKVAGTAPCAPVFLCYPEDILGQEVEIGSDLPQQPVGILEDPWVPPSQIACIAKLLADSKRPIIIAGDEVSSTSSADLVSKLAALLKIPVFQESRRSALTWNIAKDDPAYSGEYNVRNSIIRDADVILALGCRLSVEFAPVDLPDVPPTSKLIHVHRNPWELGKLYTPEIAVMASVRSLLQGLLEFFAKHEGFLGAASNHELVEVWPHGVHISELQSELSSGLSLTASDVASSLARHAPRDAVIVDEAIRSSQALLDAYPFRPGTYFHSSGGGLGWGLPAALGVQMAWPDRTVICATGDGSLLFAIQALWTAVRENLPVKVVVFNNAKYLAVKAGMVDYNHKAVASENFPGVDLTNPTIDFVALASGFGVSARVIKNQIELDESMAWAFGNAGPFLLDIAIEDAPLY